MERKRIIRVALIFVVMTTTVGCDQFTKHVVRQRLDADDRITFAGGHFTLMKVENTGAFLSLGNTLGEPTKFALLVFLPVMILTFAFWFVVTSLSLSKLRMIGLCWVIGGGVGNIYDRVAHGSVTDFMHIDFILFQTGIFNIADLSILTGVCILFVDSYITRSRLRSAS